MGDLRALERRLERLHAFDQPRIDLEQYPTPAPLAARILHTARMRGDLAERTVLDLGAGTGVLSIGAALAGAGPVVGVEIDEGALEIARQNERAVARADSGAPAAAGATADADTGGALAIEWVRADATRPPLPPADGPTVVMNPPFGARDGQGGADRAFLTAASTVAGVSYSVHNAGSLDFLEAFAADHGGQVTDAFAAELALAHTFEFHDAEREVIDVVVARIDWTGGKRTDAG